MVRQRVRAGAMGTPPGSEIQSGGEERRGAEVVIYTGENLDRGVNAGFCDKSYMTGFIYADLSTGTRSGRSGDMGIARKGKKDGK